MSYQIITEYWLIMKSVKNGQVINDGPFYSHDAMYRARAMANNRGYVTEVRTRKVKKLFY